MEKAVAIGLTPLGEQILKRFVKMDGSGAAAKFAMRKLYRLRLTSDDPVTIEVAANHPLARAVAPVVFTLQLQTEWNGLGAAEGIDYTLEVR